MRMLKTLVCCAIVGFSTGALSKVEPLDKIAATVNDAIITQSEVMRQMKIIQQQLKDSGNNVPESKALQKQVLDHLILTEVQIQMAKRTGIQVDDMMLDNAIEKIAKDNQITVTHMRQVLAQQGLDFNVYRNNVRQQIIISQLQQRDILPEIQVSEQEVNQFLQSPNGLGGLSTEYRVGHILVPLSDSPSPEELDKANEKVKSIIQKLRQGEDFAKVAIADSTGENALNGGDLGWRKLPELPTLFEKVVPTLKTNEIPEAIRSSSGLHIIKLIDKRSASSTAPAVAKTKVRHILIKTNANTSDNEAKAKLAELKKKISQGEDFAQLAKTHSSDLASASKGGSLGWVSKEVLVPEFSTVMDSLAVNDISEPFKSSFGWHIMQVEDRKTLSSDELALRQKAKDMLQQRKFEEKLQIWARQLRDEAYVKIFDES
ncbi:MAG: peptidylprolyl isomerase [Proteobacteria bacterium]|nr:peptidylprolyl isomerase [Pseudomonadota bacterium]